MSTLENCANIAKTSTPNSETQKIETQACLDDLVCPKSSEASSPQAIREELGKLTGRLMEYKASKSAEMGSMDGSGGMEIPQSMDAVNATGKSYVDYQAKVLETMADSLEGTLRAQKGATIGSMDGAGGMEISEGIKPNVAGEDFFDFVSGNPKDTLTSFTDQVMDAHYAEKEKGTRMERYTSAEMGSMDGSGGMELPPLADPQGLKNKIEMPTSRLKDKTMTDTD
jgi:hypothetical protein